MTRVWLLLLRRAGADLLLAHAAGVVLLGVVLGVEGADLGPAELARVWADQLPALWAQASPVLTVVGSSLALFRMRRDGVVLALGTFGVSPRVALLVGLLLGLLLGGIAAPLAGDHRRSGAAEWIRADGGWVRNGVVVPDTPGGEVVAFPPPSRPTWSPVLTGGAAGAAGAALGLWSGGLATVVTAVLLLVGNTLVMGLVARAALPAASAAVPALLLLLGVGGALVRAPLFPRRWG